MELPKGFYLQDTEKVARGLIGKVIVRRVGKEVLSGKIIETEAYYGEDDPASRAYNGVNKISELMYGKSGKILIYTVHNNLMLNIVAHKPRGVGAVLIRALEPMKGIEKMKELRGKEGFDICNGPGKLTKALGIGKSHHDLSVFSKGELSIMDSEDAFEILSSNRIGVKKDLRRKLRFYIKGNKWVSKGKVIAQEFY